MNTLRSKTVLILNGPNLNMLGVREPHIYGHETLDDVRALCEASGKDAGLVIDFRQSNHEGEIVTWIQQERENIAGLIINAGAYTHTSLAIHDALKLLNVPIVEVHLSDPEKREEFRHFSYISLVAAHIVKGRGAKGYPEAVQHLSGLIG